MESIIIYSNNESKVNKLQIGNTLDTTTRVDNADNNITEMLLSAGVRYMGEETIIVPKGVYKNKTMTTEFLNDVVVENGRTTNEIIVKAKFRTSQAEITRKQAEAADKMLRGL